MRVYLFCTATWSSGDQSWTAVAEDGRVIAGHMSSSREWGIRDVGPDGFYADRYPENAEVVVLPHGEQPPAEVLEAAWARVEAGR